VATQQRFFIGLSYDGTAYHGWQIQPNAVTVMEHIDKALSTIFRQPVETVGCGRTDTGVHAKQFFAHFDVEEPIDHSPLSVAEGAKTIDYGLWAMDKIKSINAILPFDIAIKDIFPVGAAAHARFDATLRSYEYYIHFNKDPFKHGYSWLMRDEPDIDLMNQGAKIIMEYTDFSCFSKSNTQVKTNNCKISKAEWIKMDGGMVFRISADRFLRNMVRAIVGTLLEVGTGKMTEGEFEEVIKSKKRTEAGQSVPAHALYLAQVGYDFERLKWIKTDE